MSSIIVIGTNTKEKTEKIAEILKMYSLKIDENNPDVLMIEQDEGKKSIGISQVKVINKFISEKPYSHKFRAVVIGKGELVTVQAQNALLKNLEEHPEYVHIILGVKTEKDVLETVLSRCKRINLKNVEKTEGDEKTFEEFINMEVGDRIDYVTEISKYEKEDIVLVLENWLLESRGNVEIFGSSPVEKIIILKRDLENTNVNTKLALENLAINL